MTDWKWRTFTLHIAAGVLFVGALAGVARREADRLVEQFAAELRSAELRSAATPLATCDREVEELARSTEALGAKFDALRLALLAAAQRTDLPLSQNDAGSRTGAIEEPDGNPDRGRLLADAGRLAAAGDTLQAERTLELLLLRYPDDPEGSLALGELLAAEYGEDPATLRRAARLAGSAGRDSRFAAASHALLGSIARDSGDSGTAEYNFRRAVSLDPGTVEYSRQLGMVLYDEGKWSDALGQFELVAASGGNGDPAMRYCRAMAEANLGYRRRAAAELEALFADEPDSYGAAEAAGNIYSLLGEHENAARLFSAAAEIRRSWQLMQRLGREELADGRSGAATSSFTVALHLLSDDPSATAEQQDELLRDLARAKNAGNSIELH